MRLKIWVKTLSFSIFIGSIEEKLPKIDVVREKIAFMMNKIKENKKIIKTLENMEQAKKA